MTWRDDLLDGALDGVPFLFEEISSEVGRRGVLHEFAGGDTPFAEDLGRAARTYQVRAFLLGPNYHVDRDRLIDVIEAGGDHVFTHPYMGEFQVKILARCPLRESDQQGGFVSIDLPLTESGLAFPMLAIATPAQIKILAADVLGKLSAKTLFDLLGAIAAVLKSVAGAIESAGSAIRKVNGKIGGMLSLVDNISSALDALVSEINTLMNTPQALMNTLSQLIGSVLDLLTVFAPATAPLGVVDDAVDNAQLVKICLSSMKELFAFETEAEAIPTPTSQSTIERRAHLALKLTVQGAALASGSAVLAELELESADQANTIVADLVAMFSEIMNADLDTEVTDAFAALKAATIEHFAATAQALPQLSTHTPQATMPAVVLAYELYGDASRDEDVIRRNRIRHPAFVMGGRQLEVLASG